MGHLTVHPKGRPKRVTPPHRAWLSVDEQMAVKAATTTAVFYLFVCESSASPGGVSLVPNHERDAAAFTAAAAGASPVPPPGNAFSASRTSAPTCAPAVASTVSSTVFSTARVRGRGRRCSGGEAARSPPSAETLKSIVKVSISTRARGQGGVDTAGGSGNINSGRSCVVEVMALCVGGKILSAQWGRVTVISVSHSV